MGPAPPRPSRDKVNPRNERKRKDKEELADLQRAVDDYTSADKSELFTDLPLSSSTLQGLESAYYSKLTDIQARALPLALKGKDVLAAARTGSGKTLAFLIPILEILLRKKWGPTDGLGALVISPTRELVSHLPLVYLICITRY